MNDGPGLDLLELRRRLTDLAESAEAETPWDDPIPHVLQAAKTAELQARPRRNPGPFTVVRGHVSRISWPSLNPVPIISVAAAFLVVAVIGVLLHGAGGSAEKKSSAASAAGGTIAAGAGTHRNTSQAAAGSGTVPGPGVPGSSGPGPVPRALCGSSTASSRLVLSAPSELVQGGVVRVRVAMSGGLRLTSPTILVRSGSDVVGRLVPSVITPSPTGSRAVGSFVTTGRLVRTPASCGDLPNVPAPASQRALPAGRYVLVVTGSTGAERVVSAPVAITIHR